MPEIIRINLSKFDDLIYILSIIKSICVNPCNLWTNLFTSYQS